MRELKVIWLVIYDGVGGELPSVDAGNPWRTRKAAREAIKRLGQPKAQNYRLAKFVREDSQP